MISRLSPALRFGGGIFLLNVLLMPADLYVGDANAVRKEAACLIETGRWGIPFSRRSELGGLAEVRGQYFFENDAKARFYSKYGVLNTLLVLPPLLAEKIRAGALPLSETSPALLLFLNLYNAFLGGVLAGYLLWAAGRWTRRAGVAAAWALSALFATFLWEYVRAQTLEIFQVVLFTAAWAHLGAWRDGGRRGHLMLSLSFLTALTLTKLYYGAFFLPVLALLSRDRRALAWGGGALLVAAVLGGAANGYRFGSPFATGYGQWLMNGLPHDRFSPAHLPAALWGFMVSPQRSVFLHFPLLLAAAAGFPHAWGRRRAETAVLWACGALLLLVVGSFSNWPGHACYGPRYLLLLLPVLSLPAAGIMESVVARRRHGVAAGLALLLLLSLRGQARVAAFPFLAYYRVAGPFASYADGKIDGYFARRTFPSVYGDLRDAWRGRRPFYPLARLAEILPPGERDAEVSRAVRGLEALRAPNFRAAMFFRRRQNNS